MNLKCQTCLSLQTKKVLIGVAVLLDLAMAIWQLENISEFEGGGNIYRVMVAIVFIRCLISWFIFAIAATSLNRNIKCCTEMGNLNATTT